MVTITERADRVLKRKVFGDGAISPLRIYRKNGGCCGKILGVGLDQPTDTDVVIQANEYTFIVEPSLYNTAKDLTVDYHAIGPKTGFTAIPRTPLPHTNCGSCKC